MAFVLRIRVSSACRDEGRPEAVAVATVTRRCVGTPFRHVISQPLALLPPPTGKRAGLIAIAMALEWALMIHGELAEQPQLVVHVCSDSIYAVRSMNALIFDEEEQEHINPEDQPLTNPDIMLHLLELADAVRTRGYVTYTLLAPCENRFARDCAQEKLAEL